MNTDQPLESRISIDSMEFQVGFLTSVKEIEMANTKDRNPQQHADKSTDSNRHKGNQGFASMDDQKQRDIAAEGDEPLMKKGTAHEFDSEEARRAGAKGGKAAHEKGTAHEFDSEEAKAAGKKGGEASHSGGRR